MTVKNIKKKIINDWVNHFESLSIYSQNKVYKIIGSYIVGLEIISLPRRQEYRPIFVCYSLWESDIKISLEEPCFTQEIKNKRGFQFDIPYLDHQEYIEEGVECSKAQAPMLCLKKVSLDNLFDTINKQFSDILVKSSPVSQAKLFEAKLMGALYINNMDTISELLEEIQIASKNWRPDLFEWKFGKVEDWLDKLKGIVNNRDDFLKQIELNKQDKKISKLKQFDLLP